MNLVLIGGIEKCEAWFEPSGKEARVLWVKVSHGIRAAHVIKELEKLSWHHQTGEQLELFDSVFPSRRFSFVRYRRRAISNGVQGRALVGIAKVVLRQLQSLQ